MELKKPDGSYIAVLDLISLKELVYTLENFGSEIAIDTETTSVDYLKCDLLGISITHSIGRAYYIPIQKHLTQQLLWDNPNEYLDLDTVRSYLNPVFANPKTTKILHNAKFDLHVLKRHGFILNGYIFDTMIGAWILGNIHDARYGLKDLAARKLGYQMTEFKEVVGKKASFSDVPIKDATSYAAADADMTKRLYHIEVETLERFPSLRETFDLEMPCVSVLQYMEEVGALIDSAYLKKLRKPLEKDMKLYEDIVLNIVGDNVNINSDEQLLPVLNKLLSPLNLNSVKFEELISHADKYPVIDSFIRYKKRSKLLSVYVDGMVKLLDDNDRVHTEYQQNKKTGRLSSNKPNLQNIPTKKDDPTNPAYEYTKDLPLIRKAFIAQPGYKIVSIDYSQLELRLTAHRANEPSWIEAYNKDVDIHKATAAAVFKIPIKEVTKDQRFRAKAINFGLLYGMTEYGLSRRIKCSIDEAREFIARYFENLPMVRKYIEDRKQEVIDRRYVETEIGRRLYFRYNLENPKSLPAAQREAINMPIQGQAADIVKKAMVEVYNILPKYKSNMILQVHDELDFEMAEDEMEILIPQIVDIMSSVYKLSVPLKVDVEFGDNWEQLRDWK